MSWNISKLYKQEGDTFIVDPAVMYPATLARIRQCVENNTIPDELGEPEEALRQLKQARRFTDEDWALATPARPEVLGFAFGWFKETLSLKVGRGLTLHLTRNDEWKERP